MAILVPCLVVLRAEFNTLAPNRDKGADGWIGDTAHQQESSDHNGDETGRTPTEDADDIDEVHAIDVDSDLGPGMDLADYVERIRVRHERGQDNRLQYIIYRGRICSAARGWTWREYIGKSAHFDHAHFSVRYTTAQENDTRPWGVLEDDDMITPEQFAALLDNEAVAAKLMALAGRGVHNQRIGKGNETIGQDLQSDEDSELLARFDEVDARLTAIEAKL
jgi:hypothetical protein